MKIGIVYYSRTGNTKKVAELLKEHLEKKKADVDLIEIIHEKKPGFLKASRAGMKQTEPPIKNTDFDVSKYNTLIIGMPIWAFNPSPYFRSYFSNVKKLNGKKAGVFMTGGGEPEKNAQKGYVIKDYLEDKGASTIDTILTLQMQKGNKITNGEQHIEDFANKIIK
jgi:flavodoxin